MRLQLGPLTLAWIAALATASSSHADGTLTARAVYYKERSTRVVQPMLDGAFDVGARGVVSTHFLVDAITSASVGSGAANATPFTERRYEAGGGYTHELDGPTRWNWLDKLRIGANAKYSTESDYGSFYAGGRIEADVAQKNAVLGVGGGVATDSISNAGAQGPLGGPLLRCSAASTVVADTCRLTSYSGFASASQIVSKYALIGVTYDITKLDGYQANPYRQVVTTGGLYAEVHPSRRLRQAIAASGRFFVATTRTTLIAAYRYYRDDWRVRAHTPELRIVQDLGDFADVGLRYRYYRQTAAYFYRSRYSTPDPMMVTYLSDDPKMSAYDGHVVEAKLGSLGRQFALPGRWAAMRIEALGQYVVQHNRFGNAVVFHVALTLPFDY